VGLRFAGEQLSLPPHRRRLPFREVRLNLSIHYSRFTASANLRHDSILEHTLREPVNGADAPGLLEE
jgi:hypothetical protein